MINRSTWSPQWEGLGVCSGCAGNGSAPHYHINRAHTSLSGAGDLSPTEFSGLQSISSLHPRLILWGSILKLDPMVKEKVNFYSLEMNGFISLCTQLLGFVLIPRVIWNLATVLIPWFFHLVEVMKYIAFIFIPKVYIQSWLTDGPAAEICLTSSLTCARKIPESLGTSVAQWSLESITWLSHPDQQQNVGLSFHGNCINELKNYIYWQVDAWFVESSVEL